MPFVSEPHFCKPPLWPRLYRSGVVWKCRHCGAVYKNERKNPGYRYDKTKQWKRLEPPKPKG